MVASIQRRKLAVELTRFGEQVNSTAQLRNLTARYFRDTRGAAVRLQDLQPPSGNAQQHATNAIVAEPAADAPEPVDRGQKASRRRGGGSVRARPDRNI